MAAKVSVLVDLMSAVGMLLLMMGTSCAYDFYVGGRDGWVQNPSENFNHWAERNRFQVNDKLVFKYKKGENSVLVVSEADYRSCSASNPIRRLDDGDSVFQFDRSGPFFFISGTPGRCQSGQKLIVVVLAVRNPKPAPSPNPPATPAPLPSPPQTPSPLPSPPQAAPTPSPKAAPTPSPSTARAPSPSTAAPSPSSSHPSPAPSPSLSPAPSPSGHVTSPSPAPSPSEPVTSPSPSEPVTSPSPAPAADQQAPESSPAAPAEEPSANSSVPRPAPSSSSYTGASLWTVAVAVALGAVTFLVY